MITLLALHSLLPAATPAPQHHTAAPPASTPALDASTPVPGTHGTTPTPRLSTAQWLRGLARLRAYLNNMMARDTGVVTPGLLRSDARHLRRCSPGLARLGPPGARLLAAYQIAAQACGQLTRAANCDIAAAKAYDPYSPTPQFTKLLNCSNNSSTNGSILIGEAVATGIGN